MSGSPSPRARRCGQKKGSDQFTVGASYSRAFFEPAVPVYTTRSFDKPVFSAVVVFACLVE